MSEGTREELVARYHKLVEELSGGIKNVMNDWLIKHKDTLSNLGGYTVCLEVLSFKLGYVNVICDRLGLDEAKRLNILSRFMVMGAESAAATITAKHPELMLPVDIKIPKGSIPN